MEDYNFFNSLKWMNEANTSSMLERNNDNSQKSNHSLVNGIKHKNYQHTRNNFHKDVIVVSSVPKIVLRCLSHLFN